MLSMAEAAQCAYEPQLEQPRVETLPEAVLFEYRGVGKAAGLARGLDADSLQDHGCRIGYLCRKR